MKGFNELVDRLNQISNQWVLSNRSHDTGIGKTLEDMDKIVTEVARKAVKEFLVDMPFE